MSQNKEYIKPPETIDCKFCEDGKMDLKERLKIPVFVIAGIALTFCFFALAIPSTLCWSYALACIFLFLPCTQYYECKTCHTKADKDDVLSSQGDIKIKKFTCPYCKEGNMVSQSKSKFSPSSVTAWLCVSFILVILGLFAGIWLFLLGFVMMGVCIFLYFPSKKYYECNKCEITKDV